MQCNAAEVCNNSTSMSKPGIILLCGTVKACLGVTLTTNKREFISASPCWVVEALNPRFLVPEF